MHVHISHVNVLSLMCQRLVHAGCILTSAESCIFELLGDAQHPRFKAIVPLVKELAKSRSSLPAPTASKL